MFNEFKNIIFVIALLFLFGSIGYSLIEGWDFLDSVYMTIITLSTTGFKEIKPMSDMGKIFTMALIVFGISILFYAISNLNIVLFERNIFKEKKMQKKIKNLKNHYIICGFGRMGHKIAQELEKRKKQFVIIEKDEQNINHENGFNHILGDATEDENLIAAGIENAIGFVSVLKDDVSNVFATLSARELNPKLKIIARAEDERSKEKLLKAGANKVILPYEIGGFRITQALLKPIVLDYFDEIFSRSDIGLVVDEIRIEKDSYLIGKSLAESNIRSELNVIIIGIYRSDGTLVYNPRSETKLELLDTLIVIGENNELSKLHSNIS